MMKTRIDVLTVEARIEKVRAMLRLARRDAEFAVACREAWLPTVHDSTLHERMGTSYATNTFLTIRTALRREILSALMRIWDNRSDSIDFPWMIEQIRDPDFIARLVSEHYPVASSPPANANSDENVNVVRRLVIDEHIARAMRGTIERRITDILSDFEHYTIGEGKRHFGYLKRLRHEQLAHTQSTELTPPPPEFTDEATDQFFLATTRIICNLLGVVEAMSYSLADTASIYQRHARFFWASARGERTEGHPNYWQPRGLK